MAWAPPSKPGDRSPSIVDAKRKLRVYSYGKGLGETDEYTVAFGVALVQFQTNRNLQILAGTVQNMPGMNTSGVLDWATKKNLGILPEQLNPPPASVPVVFTVTGHMNAMDWGPAYWAARPLEEQRRIRIQMVGYNNGPIPFDNRSGVVEIDRLVNDPRVLPPGTDWAFSSHSQGAIVTALFWREIIEPNRGRWPYNHFRGGLAHGDPMRPKGVCAAWIPDKPSANSEGLAGDCLTAQIPGVEEVVRKGDLFSDKERDAAGAYEYKTAIYKIVQGEIFGTDSITEQMMELMTVFTNPTELWAVFLAIVGGIQFLVDMSPHDQFDLRPGTDHLARVLKV